MGFGPGQVLARLIEHHAKDNTMSATDDLLHPGLAVRYHCLEPLGMTVTEAARVLGVSRKSLSELVNGHASITPQMAIRLSKAFGTTPELWAGIQFDYNMAQAKKRADRIKVKRVAAPA